MANKSPVIRARCSKCLKNRLARKVFATGIRESDFVRIAIEEFLASYPTAQAAIKAVGRGLTAELLAGAVVETEIRPS